MRTRTLVALVPLLLFAALLPASCGGGNARTTQTGSGEVFVQSAGEIFLEPAGDPGPDSFAGSALIFDHAIPSPTSLAVLTTLPALPGSPMQVAALAGDASGLYGGSRDKLIADKDAQLNFLLQNLDKAAAFCAALNADSTLRWSGGSQVTVEQLAAYFAELTPVLITRDLRVTNHGFRDGKPTPRQSILQAGQYILVDIFGVPRARCECGNPLIPPIAVATKPRYTGMPWPGFDPSVVIVVQAAATMVESFILTDVETGQTFERTVGSSGAGDTDRTTTTTLPPTTTSSSTTTMSSTTTTLAAETSVYGTWEGTFFVDRGWDEHGAAINTPATVDLAFELYPWNGSDYGTIGSSGLVSGHVTYLHVDGANVELEITYQLSGKADDHSRLDLILAGNTLSGDMVGDYPAPPGWINYGGTIELTRR